MKENQGEIKRLSTHAQTMIGIMFRSKETLVNEHKYKIGEQLIINIDQINLKMKVYKVDIVVAAEDKKAKEYQVTKNYYLTIIDSVKPIEVIQEKMESFRQEIQKTQRRIPR
jgi:hypothetical protein